MVFHKSLSDSKSPQVSSILHSIPADLNSVIVWMVSTGSLISKSSCPFNNPLDTVPKAPITIGIIVTFMFHSFFSIPLQSRGTYLSFHFQFYSVVSRDSKIHNPANSLFFFLLIIIKSGRLAQIRGSVCMSKSHRNLCVSFSKTDVEWCIYHLFFFSLKVSFS